MEKALVARLGAARVPGLVQVLGTRLENRRADDELHLLEVRPPEGADTINPLETDPDRLRRACMVGRDALRAVLDADADPDAASA